MKLFPKNWAEFQHYRNRLPPWIKLHKGLLDDRQYQRLPLASRALAPMLWLLASESKDGAFDGSTEELAFRLRADEGEIDAGIAPLIAAGFFVRAEQVATVVPAPRRPVADKAEATREQVATHALAGCGQVAVPETEAETEEKAEKKPRKARPVSREVTLTAYLELCKAEGRKPIPPDHTVRAYSNDAGISDDMLQVAWLVFKDRHLNADKAKTYRDWPGAFANSVKGRWYRLWTATPDGAAEWTPTGLQERRVIEARINATQEAANAPE